MTVVHLIETKEIEHLFKSERNFIMKTKFYLSTLLLSGALIASAGSLQANESQTPIEYSHSSRSNLASEDHNVEILMQAFQKGLMNMSSTRADFDPYYSKEYVQHVDGKTLNYEEFLAHMADLHKSLSSLEIEFLDIVTQGDKVATRHLAHGIKKDGREIEVLVVAVFGFKNGKLVSCDELTHMVRGAKEDRDIGSRH